MNGVEYSFAGLGLTLLALGLAGIVIAGNRWIRKVTNTYWFWLAISIFYITYCIVICWSKYWNQFAHTIFTDPTTNPRESNIISKAFMLNICPFLNFVLPITLIADPSRKTARAFAPMALVSSLMVILVAIPNTSDIEFNWWNIFIGTANITDLYYFGHVTNLLIALGVVLNTPRFRWKGLITAAGALLGFYIYVISVSHSLGVRWQVAGITLNDFGPEGTYYFFEKAFKTNYVAAQATYFVALIIFVLGTVFICDLCKKQYFAYGNKYSGCWWHWYDYKKVANKEPLNFFCLNKK